MITRICFLLMLGFNIYSAIRQRKLIRENDKLRKDYDTLNVRYASTAYQLGLYTLCEKNQSE